MTFKLFPGFGNGGHGNFLFVIRKYVWFISLSFFLNSSLKILSFLWCLYLRFTSFFPPPIQLSSQIKVVPLLVCCFHPGLSDGVLLLLNLLSTFWKHTLNYFTPSWTYQWLLILLKVKFKVPPLKPLVIDSCLPLHLISLSYFVNCASVAPVFFLLLMCCFLAYVAIPHTPST